MKKTLLLINLFFATAIISAQVNPPGTIPFEVLDNSNNSVVTDGQVISFSDAGCGYNDPCNWKFAVTNTGTGDIYMKIFVDNLTNTDGSNFQLCFAGVCLNNVTLGSGYPSTAAMIAPGVTNSAGNNFWNQNPSTTSVNMSWTFRFQAFDAAGFEIGTPLSVTYNFDPSLSVENVDLASSVKVFPTQVTNEITVTTNETLTAQFYDILGKNVKQVDILSGESKINVSDLTPQLYMIRFTDNIGNILIKKIIVK